MELKNHYNEYLMGSVDGDSRYFYLHSVAKIKHYDQKQLRRRNRYFCFLSQYMVCSRKLGQKLRQKLEQRPWKVTASWLYFSGLWVSLFSYATKNRLPQGDPIHSGLSMSSQPKRVPPDMPTGQCG